jgi:hypothetical protein
MTHDPENRSSPGIERGLLARAHAKGVSLADFAQEVLAREANHQARRGRISKCTPSCV